MDLLKRIEELENKMNFLIQRQGEQQQQFYRMQEARQHEFRQFQEAQQYEYRKLQEELFFLKKAYQSQQSLNKQPSPPLQQPERAAAADIIYPKNNPASKPEQEEVRLEKYFGKNIMGIIASLLIFIALISFAILIYDKITDLIKCCGMYLLSIGLGFTGFWFGRKKRNPFTISLLSCGVGGIYISIIATHLVFHYISGIMIYVLLFIWVSGLMLLKEKLQYQKLFRIICQLGVLFSLFLAYADTISILEYALISLYTFISFGIINIKNNEKNVVNLIGEVITGISFCNICMINTIGVDSPVWQMKGLVLFNLFIFMIFVVFTVSKFSKETTEYEGLKVIAAAFIGCSYLIGVIIGMAGVFDFDSDQYLGLSIIYLAVILIPGLLGKLRNEMEKAIFIPVLIILPILLGSLIQSISGLNITGLALMYIPLLFWGIRQKKKLYEITAYILIVFNLLLIRSYNSNISVSYELIIEIVLVMACLWTILFYYWKTEKSVIAWGYKLYIHLATVFAVCQFIIIFHSDNEYYFLLMVNALLFALVIQIGYYDQGSDQSDQVNSVKNILIMIASTIIFILIIECIWQRELSIAFAIPFILLGVGYTLLNNKTFYSIYKNTAWFGWFVGIKLTLLCLAVVLSTFDLSNYPYIVSILLVLIACICIAVGFKKDFTSFRVYGLVLTIAAVLKLVTYDIMKLNSMIRVGAFVVGGILCFMISRLYNNASKKNERL